MPRYARPSPREFSPFYAEYIASVPDGDVLDLLEAQQHEIVALLRPQSAAQWQSRYAPGKWSVSEVLGHLCDAERILSYRALRFARGDQTPLAGFEENDYVPPAQFDGRNPESLLVEHAAIRGSTLALFRHLPDDAPERIGSANGAEVSVRALLYIITGHERHHVRVLRERYL
ncbi:MAG: DinB family protein [Gemmatimonadota bacterium]|nr:DinB family protein [Gemmatimonadota bacterium]MDH4350973.1 DinB family protein [Gemmatimonadota bacterium]MDH5196960.1 DinB family protein [Gemmatimonadota bacterium]